MYQAPCIYIWPCLLCYDVHQVPGIGNVPIDRRVCMYVRTCVYDVCAVTRQVLRVQYNRFYVLVHITARSLVLFRGVRKRRSFVV